ncbi:MAG: F0F1 ATP synthase subunit A [Dehalococcoidia bacterium]
MPILVIFGLAVVALLVVGFLSGALGQALFGDIGLPGFISVARPHPELPTETVFHLLGFPVSNTILAAWITMLMLIGLFFAATRKMKLVPRGLQNFMEFIVEALLNFVEGVAGRENGRRFFPVVATIFLFVAFNAWLSLVPGFGSILIGEGEHRAHLLRGANTDINLPLALALMSFIFVEYWGITSVGFLRYIQKFINVRNLFRGRLFTGAIDVFVGALETLSEFIRIVSFTFRLFGNMTAGEILLLIMFFLVPWVVALPFYGLEMMVGFVQALIFSGLTLVFATLAVAAHGEGHE